MGRGSFWAGRVDTKRAGMPVAQGGGLANSESFEVVRTALVVQYRLLTFYLPTANSAPQRNKMVIGTGISIPQPELQIRHSSAQSSNIRFGALRGQWVASSVPGPSIRPTKGGNQGIVH
jgi:hypothetical protein